MNLHHLQTPATLKHYASTSVYEDPFSDVVSAFEAPVQHDPHDPETPSIDRDNKLLSFSAPSFAYTLLDYTYRRTTISLSSQLHGMFFLAESPSASAGDAQPPPSELTCYRRNLFQITGEITLPRTLRYIMTEQGEQIPIIGQELVISATESTEGNAVKIISVPWKTPANPNGPASTEEKAEREPPSIPLDLTNVQEMSTDFASFPFQWKRLQFRIATANNGRRKELQQHFVVKLKVLATLATGGKITICEVQSGAIIVRGRSPRNFQSRKDLPLNGSGGGGHARKGSNLTGQPSRVSSADSGGGKTRYDGPTSNPIKTEAMAAQPMSLASFYDPQEHHAGEAFHFGQSQANAGASQAAKSTSKLLRSPLNMRAGHAAASPDLSRSSQILPPQPPSAPINLSLVEDESTKSGTPPDGRNLSSSAKRLHMMARPPSFTLRETINSPDESADLLYEYFPLGLDDWMPPVEAVYRPHVVHHTKLPIDPRFDTGGGIGKKGRSKRYFSEDVSCSDSLS